MTGPITVIKPANRVADDRPSQNKAVVLEAMTSLFQRRDASAVERVYAADYIQHNPTIPQGRADAWARDRLILKARRSTEPVMAGHESGRSTRSAVR